MKIRLISISNPEWRIDPTGLKPIRRSKNPGLMRGYSFDAKVIRGRPFECMHSVTGQASVSFDLTYRKPVAIIVQNGAAALRHSPPAGRSSGTDVLPCQRLAYRIGSLFQAKTEARWKNVVGAFLSLQSLGSLILGFRRIRHTIRQQLPASHMAA